MKIEIGESLLLSYLKHVKKCVFYQTSWQPSPQWERSNCNEVEEVYNEIQEDLQLEGVFKANGLEQLLRQAEINVLGMDQDGKIYLVDTAFHENGLQYGSTEESVQRTLKKLLRSYLILRSYFPDCSDSEVIFASPKVRPGLDELLKERIEYLNENYDYWSEVKFRYISNKDYEREILMKTLESSSDASDTTELFLRSMKLLSLFDEIESVELPEASFVEEAGEVMPTLQGENKSDGYALELIPSSLDDFSRQLCKSKLAKRTWTYNDGRVEVDYWVALNFTEGSDPLNNIRSSKARHYRTTGLVHLKVEVVSK